jgi:hypothetical protein
MDTSASAIAPRRLRTEDVFFLTMVLLILAAVVIGFGQTYFVPGMVFAKLPNALVHVHGALFVSWILLLVIQTVLVSVNRVQWHMRLGILGVVLAPLMVIVGTWTILDSIHRRGIPRIPPGLMLAGDLLHLVFFAIFVIWGLSQRWNKVAHKRLMLFSTIAILLPALNRWPFAFMESIPAQAAVFLAFPALIVIYDLVALKKIHWSTLWASLLILLMVALVLLIPGWGMWQRFTVWVQGTSWL